MVLRLTYIDKMVKSCVFISETTQIKPVTFTVKKSRNQNIKESTFILDDGSAAQVKRSTDQQSINDSANTPEEDEYSIEIAEDIAQETRLSFVIFDTNKMFVESKNTSIPSGIYEGSLLLTKINGTLNDPRTKI